MLDPEAVDAGVATLIDRGDAAFEKTVRLTKQGATAAKGGLGRDAGEPWPVIQRRRLPLLALGLDPDAPAVRRTYGRFDALRAAAVAVSFGLPAETMGKPKAVASELVWRMLRARLGEVIGKGPFPAIDKPGPVEWSLLAGLAGRQARNQPDAMAALAAHALRIAKADSDGLRKRLITTAIARGRNSDVPDTGHEAKLESPRAGSQKSGHTGNPAAPAATAINGEFVDNVQTVAAALSTPPFQGRVAIAQVYDAYGRQHADAGSLQSFKERLISAAEARTIELSRLDMPQRMAKELRERSETQFGNDRVHFIVTEWR